MVSFPKLILLKGFCFTFSNLDETNTVDEKFPRLLGLDGGTGLVLGSFPKLILLKGFCFTFSNIDETNTVDEKFP